MINCCANTCFNLYVNIYGRIKIVVPTEEDLMFSNGKIYVRELENV